MFDLNLEALGHVIFELYLICCCSIVTVGIFKVSLSLLSSRIIFFNKNILNHLIGLFGLVFSILIIYLVFNTAKNQTNTLILNYTIDDSEIYRPRNDSIMYIDNANL